ncbi:MAG: hypothetical protein, partial [Olavius algarvensis Gamma 1 endosymbiont]
GSEHPRQTGKLRHGHPEGQGGHAVCRRRYAPGLSGAQEPGSAGGTHPRPLRGPVWLHGDPLRHSPRAGLHRVRVPAATSVRVQGRDLL